jgi:hypothetical protein
MMSFPSTIMNKTLTNFKQTNNLNLKTLNNQNQLKKKSKHQKEKLKLAVQNKKISLINLLSLQ